jgi:hypothetical protein
VQARGVKWQYNCKQSARADGAWRLAPTRGSRGAFAPAMSSFVKHTDAIRDNNTFSVFSDRGETDRAGTRRASFVSLQFTMAHGLGARHQRREARVRAHLQN